MNFNIEAIMSCPVCGRKHLRGSARVVMRKRTHVLLHASCAFCSTSSMMLVARKNGQKNVISIGSLTDLSFEEAASIIKQRPLTINEVIDICSSINNQL
jgi:formate dehydrogenase maturation protein FdhE